MGKDDNLTMPQKLERANQGLENTQAVEEVQIVETVGISDFSESAPSFWPNYLSAIFIIMALLGVLYAGLWLMRRLGYGGAVSNSSKFNRADLRIEAQLPLGPKRQLYLVRYMNKRLLLGATDSSINLLNEEYVLNDDTGTGINADDVKSFEETIQNFTEHSGKKSV